jgi:hypothetical protein
MRDDPIGRRKVELLIRYLSFTEINGGSDVSALCLAGHAWSDVVAAALSSQLYPALVHTLGRRDQTSFDALARERFRAPHLANFNYRNASQRRHLVAAVRALNAAGIEPCLAGGARELWLEAPSWRFVSEIELLVEPASFKRAVAAVERCGWQQARALSVSGYRTETWLVHRDTTGHIALRATGTHSAIERVFPSSICTRGGLTVAVDRGMSRLATPAAYCLYAVGSHHFAPASRRGTVAAIKPLYELAARLIEMQPRDRSELRDMIADNSELSAIFGIWHAAACRTFGLPPVPPLDHPVGTGHSVELVDLAGQFHVALR